MFTKLTALNTPTEPVTVPEEIRKYNGGNETFQAVKRVTVVRQGLADWLCEVHGETFRC